MITKTQSKLKQARDLLAETDAKIVSLLQHFEAAASPKKLPDENTLSKYMEENPFPSNIEELAITSKTPISLIAGVAQFITPESIENNAEKFEELAKEICNRHNHTWLVVEHKIENRSQYEDENGKVNTFIQDQHDQVVTRTKDFVIQAKTEDTGASQGANDHGKESNHNNLSQNVITFLAAAGAGWQNQGINDNTGPFRSNGKPWGHDDVFKTSPVYPVELKAA